MTDLAEKSTEVTSSLTMSMPASVNHSRGRQRILAESAIRALESLVRSMTTSGSLVMMVMLPVYFSSRRVWTTPIVPLPLGGC